MKLGKDYICDGQMDIFDWLKPKEEKKNGYCHATLEPCNLEYRREVAKDCGNECTVRCCVYCNSRFCGARCNYSNAHMKKYDAIEDYASHGSGFENGKKRISEYFKSEINVDKRAKFLKHEYGVGGFGWYCEEQYKVYDGCSDASGCKAKYRNRNNDEVTVQIPYKSLAETIATMISEDRYIESEE